MQKIKTFIKKNETKLAVATTGAIILALVVLANKNDSCSRYPFSVKRYSLGEVQRVFTQFCNANDLNESEAMQKLEAYIKANS